MKNLRLKAARAALDLSQQQLADAVGVSRQTINAIEKGDYNPTIKLCTAICRRLGKTLDELFWEERGGRRGVSVCAFCGISFTGAALSRSSETAVVPGDGRSGDRPHTFSIDRTPCGAWSPDQAISPGAWHSL